jgi:hypothetical protein
MTIPTTSRVTPNGSGPDGYQPDAAPNKPTGTAAFRPVELKAAFSPVPITASEIVNAQTPAPANQRSEVKP